MRLGFITHPVIFQGILLDIHVQNWVKFLGMIDYSSAKNAEYICKPLQRKLPIDYWEAIQYNI